MRPLGIFTTIAAIIFGPAEYGQASVDRPPQFVLLAFDNCTELDRWQDLTTFVSEMESNNSPVRFTFFVSAVNFLAQNNRDLYKGPHHARGKSNIDFGGSPQDVARRVGLINGLHAAGSEVASHNVGHFDAVEENWTEADWTQELEAYKSLFTNVGANNGLPSVKFNFAFDDVVGFRAPYLSSTPGLYTVLGASRFRYDTSSDSDPKTWPKKKNGIWRFNLADLTIAGTGKKTLSMDYNFYVAQSKAHDDPANYDLYRKEMFDTYMAYFRANYVGNRAPINIGHHFAPYQGGRYHQALQAFARSVCGLPEVRCITYTQLANFMDGLSPATLAAYQNGDFPHASDPNIPVAATDYPPAISIKADGGRILKAALVGTNADRYHNGVFSWSVNGSKIGTGKTLSARRLQRRRTLLLTVVYEEPASNTVTSATQLVRMAGRQVRSVPFHAELKRRTLNRLLGQ